MDILDSAYLDAARHSVLTPYTLSLSYRDGESGRIFYRRTEDSQTADITDSDGTDEKILISVYAHSEKIMSVALMRDGFAFSFAERAETLPIYDRETANLFGPNVFCTNPENITETLRNTNAKALSIRGRFAFVTAENIQNLISRTYALETAAKTERIKRFLYGRE